MAVDHLLAEVAARAFGENGVAPAQFHAELEALVRLTVLAQPHVAGGHAEHGAVVGEQHFGRREAGKDLDAQRLGLLAEPLRHLAEADHVVAAVVQAVGDQPAGRALGLVLGQHQHLVAADALAQRRALRFPVREQLGDRARVHHRAGQDVGSRFAALFEHDDGNLLAVERGELLAADRAGQARRAATDDHDVVVHRLARAVLLDQVLGVHGQNSRVPCYRAAALSSEAAMAYSIDLSGRVALVTGASSGLGMQFAKVLAAAGAGVVLAARRVERLKTLRAEIEAGDGDAHVVGMDVTDIDSIRAAVAHAETEMGTIDILVNNSGVSTTQRLTDVTADDYDYVMDTNTRGAFFVAQEVAKRMIARSKGAAPGTFTGGRIVNIASMAGLRVLSQIGVYSMSKAAVVHMTRSMALEWGRHGINVNAHLPGLHRHRDQPPSLAERGRPEAGADAAAQAPGQAERPRHDAADAVRQREPLRQRRGDRRRRRLRGLDVGLSRRRAGPCMRALTAHEARVLGVLVEKQATVPDTYPLSLNALTAGCNQKTARDPVLALSDAQVLEAVDGLKQCRCCSRSAAAASCASSTTRRARWPCPGRRWPCSPR